MDGHERAASWSGAEEMGAVIRERLAALGASAKVLRDVDDLVERARSHNRADFKESLGLPN